MSTVWNAAKGQYVVVQPKKNPYYEDVFKYLLGLDIANSHEPQKNEISYTK